MLSSKFFKISGLIVALLLAGCSGMDRRGEGLFMGALLGGAAAAAGGAHPAGIAVGAGVGGTGGYIAGQGIKTERYYDEYQPSVQYKRQVVEISCQQLEKNAINRARLLVEARGGTFDEYYSPPSCVEQYQKAPPSRPAYRARIQYQDEQDENEYYGR